MIYDALRTHFGPRRRFFGPSAALIPSASSSCPAARPGRSGGTFAGMSEDTRQLPALRPQVYTVPIGEWLAVRVAEGDTVGALHRASPDTVAHPLAVRRWREAIPAFDALMQEAERTRAELLADQCIVAADSPRSAARTRNAIQSRQWLAARLDPVRYGERKSPGDGVSGGLVNITVNLSDAALLAIVSEARGRAPALEHDAAGCNEGERAPPAAPPVR